MNVENVLWAKRPTLRRDEVVNGGNRHSRSVRRQDLTTRVGVVECENGTVVGALGPGDHHVNVLVTFQDVAAPFSRQCWSVVRHEVEFASDLVQLFDVVDGEPQVVVARENRCPKSCDRSTPDEQVANTLLLELTKENTLVEHGAIHHLPIVAKAAVRVVLEAGAARNSIVILRK